MFIFSGAYIFRPSQQWAYPLTDASNPAKILGSFSGELVSQVWQQVTPWIVQKISLYHNNPAAIEFEWTVGPIPYEDKQGKEVVIRFNATDIDSKATWYTDSNGREFQQVHCTTLPHTFIAAPAEDTRSSLSPHSARLCCVQRVRNVRPAWKWVPTQPVAGHTSAPHLHVSNPSSASLTLLPSSPLYASSGNYYPVNAVQWLADDSDALVVANDRSQGGSSLADGSLEFMVHRRLLHDDGRGVSEALNETGLDGKGLIITGRHLVSLVKPAAGRAARARIIQNAAVPGASSYAFTPLSGSIASVRRPRTTPT